MCVICFAAIVLLEWVISQFPGILPSLFLLPAFVVLLVRLISAKRKDAVRWWVVLIYLPLSIMAVDLPVQLQRSLSQETAYSLEQFNESLLWALGLGLIQFAVFCAYLGLWNLARRASGPKEARR
jgi:hypothetical protein